MIEFNRLHFIRVQAMGWTTGNWQWLLEPWRIEQIFKWVWNSSCQNKHKVFAWLFLKDRLSTRELLKRKNMELQDYSCVLCSSLTEDTSFNGSMPLCLNLLELDWFASF
jgi:hypothetical protein